MNIAIIFAGGSGVRMGAGIPKQFLEINGKPILVHTLQLFQNHDMIDKIYLSVLEKYIPYVDELVKDFRLSKVCGIVAGGETGQDSIYNALKKAEEENDGDSIVLIHDGVRPFITYEVIRDNIESVKEHGNGITCTSCYETILLSKDGQTVGDVPYRKETYAAQAPQSFYLKDILDAQEWAIAKGERNMIDSCTLMNAFGKKMSLIDGPSQNIKITTPDDFYMFRAIFDARENQQLN